LIIPFQNKPDAQAKEHGFLRLRFRLVKLLQAASFTRRQAYNAWHHAAAREIEPAAKNFHFPLAIAAALVTMVVLA
jgi:hypothetical protein